MAERAVDYLTDAGPVVPPLAVHDQRSEYIPETICYSCGEDATGIDHVVPQAMLQTLSMLEDAEVTAILVRFNRRLTVPCCGDCNSTLSNSYQDTLEKRKAELKRRLRRRFKKFIEMPDWTDRELSQLGYRLQQHVIGAVAKKEMILRRLRY